MKSVSKGFSLLELLVGMVIITIALSAAIPPYLRNMRQQKVDFYTQQLETGFIGLRAKLGQQKTSCTLKFDTSGLSNFVAPANLVEMQENPERLECCNSDLEAAGKPNGCAYGPKIGTILAELPINLSRDERNKIIEIDHFAYSIAKRRRNLRK